MDATEQFMAHMAELAYDSSPPEFLRSSVQSTLIYRKVDNTPTDMYIYEPLTNEMNEPVLIAIAGTHSSYQVVQDLNILLDYKHLPNIPAFSNFNLTCASYEAFIRAYLLTQPSYIHGKQIMFVGHSWGAAVSLELHRRLNSNLGHLLAGVYGYAPFMYRTQLSVAMRAFTEASTTHRDSIHLYANQLDAASALLQDDTQGFGVIALFPPENSAPSISTAEALQNMSFENFRIWGNHTMTLWSHGNHPLEIVKTIPFEHTGIKIRTVKEGPIHYRLSSTTGNQPLYLWHNHTVQETQPYLFFVDIPQEDGLSRTTAEDFMYNISLPEDQPLEDIKIYEYNGIDHFTMGLTLHAQQQGVTAKQIVYFQATQSGPLAETVYTISYYPAGDTTNEDNRKVISLQPGKTFTNMLHQDEQTGEIYAAATVSSDWSTYENYEASMNTLRQNFKWKIVDDLHQVDYRRSSALPKIPTQFYTLEEQTAYYNLQIRPKKYPTRQLTVHRDEHWADSSRQGTGYDGMRILYALEDGNLDSNASGLIDEWVWQVVNLGNYNFTFTVPGTGTRLSGNAQFGHTYYPLNTNNVNTRLVYLETDNNIEYYAIVFENDNNILALRDAFGSPGVDPATSFNISSTTPTDQEVRDYVTANESSLLSFGWSIDFDNGPHSYTSSI